MESFNTANSTKNGVRSKLFILCLFISLLVHVILVFLLQQQQAEQQLSLFEQQPTIVRLVDKPKILKQLQYELDQPPPLEKTAPPEQASRLAEENQRVEKEQAPKGEDTRDQTAKPAVIEPAVKPQPRKQQTPSSEKKVKPGTPAMSPAAPKRPKTPTGKLPEQQAKSASEKPATPGSIPLPSLDQLTQLSPRTLERLAKTEQAIQEKIKQRQDIEEGDTVWLNLERGMLISFFRRFRNQIEGVWNYPFEAVQQELQGVLQLKITVNREGELLDVDLIRSSGYGILDYEAIQAVYRAAPFGPLPKHYPHPDLKINAHFRYLISGKYIYGRP